MIGAIGKRGHNGRCGKRASVRRGFTLIELMIVVAILAVLAAVAIPALVKHLRRTKTSEAVDKLAYLYRMSATYYGREHGGISHRFPDTAPITPAAIPGAVHVRDPNGTWDGPTWQALAFSISDPHYYSYEYVATGRGTTASFTARALGDLDGDSTLATFERSGGANSQFEVIGSSGVWMYNDNE